MASYLYDSTKSPALCPGGRSMDRSGSKYINVSPLNSVRPKIQKFYVT